MSNHLPLTSEQQIKEPEQQLAEFEVKTHFFEPVVKAINTKFGAIQAKKELTALSCKHRH